MVSIAHLLALLRHPQLHVPGIVALVLVGAWHSTLIDPRMMRRLCLLSVLLLLLVQYAWQSMQLGPSQGGHPEQPLDSIFGEADRVAGTAFAPIEARSLLVLARVLTSGPHRLPVHAVELDQHLPQRAEHGSTSTKLARVRATSVQQRQRRRRHSHCIGCQVSYAGSLFENIQSLANNKWGGYNPNFNATYAQVRSLAGTRLDRTRFARR